MIFIVLCESAHLHKQKQRDMEMEESLKRVVRASIADVYRKVLVHYSQYEPKPTGHHVLLSFNMLSQELLEVSSQAMRETQLSLFDHLDSILCPTI